MAKLDAEEREILEAFEADQLKPVENKNAELKKHQKYAEATFKKDQRINIRISSRDLQALKKRALAEGIPYQTLVSSILHKYVDDRLVDRETMTGKIYQMIWSTRCLHCVGVFLVKGYLSFLMLQLSI